MGVLKVSVFILCYFFARIAMSACETYTLSGTEYVLCNEEQTDVLISEKCQKRDCDAKKFLTQHKASKSKLNSKVSTVPFQGCQELQIPSLVLTSPKGQTTPFCLFQDGSLLEASTVEKLSI